MDDSRELLRHALATVAYRCEKALRDGSSGFATFRIGESSRTPVEILAHMGDLFEWALSMAKGAPASRESPPLDWNREVDRFFAALEAFDLFLASDAPVATPAERLLQGPIADALTHIGQLTMLRRLDGAPVRRESYFKADIAVGRVGREQATRPRES